MLVQKKVIVIQQAAALDRAMKHLSVYCRGAAHEYPLLMRYIGDGTSHHGQPMVVYACTYPRCDWREGWVRDRQTGRPIRLFGRVYGHGENCHNSNGYADCLCRHNGNGHRSGN